MKGYKTLLINGAVMVLPLVDMAINNGAVVGAMLGGNAAAVLSVLGLINVVLRWMTTTPVLKSE